MQGKGEGRLKVVMQKHEYKARDKTVQKMTKEGLREENLRTKSVKSLVEEEGEQEFSPEKTEQSFDSRTKKDNRISEETLSLKKKKESSRRLMNKFLVEEEKAEEDTLSKESYTSAEIERFVSSDLSHYNGREETIKTNSKENVRKRQRLQTVFKFQDKLQMESVESKVFTEKLKIDSTESEKVSESQAGEEKRSSPVLRSKPKRMLQQKESIRQNLQEKSVRKPIENVDKQKRYYEQAHVEKASLEEFKDEIKDKVKTEKILKEQKKRKSRLSFEDEEENKIPGSNRGKKVASVTAGALAAYGRQKFKGNSDDNAGVDAADQAERVGESLARKSMYLRHRYKEKRQKSHHLKEASASEEPLSRLHFEKENVSKSQQMDQEKSSEKAKKIVQKQWQKKKYQKEYQAAKQGKETKNAITVQIQRVSEKAKVAFKQVLTQNRNLLLTLGVLLLLFVLMATSISSCTGAFQGGMNAIISTSYSSEDEDIYAVENAYVALEQALNEQINRMKEKHDDYDEFRFQIDEIGHNPYHLISYLTVKYGGFTYAQVAHELELIFQEQYQLYTDSTRETVTEKRMVKVGESLGKVVTSGYCSCSVCCGPWAGGPTASGVYPKANHTIAVDASDPFVPMGTKVVMNGVEYTVEDTGAFNQYGVQFDVYYGDHASASSHGHKTWEAYIADSNGKQEVEVTTTREVNRLDVSLKNRQLDTVLRRHMTEAEEEQYDAYNRFYGNRDYLFDVNRIPTGSGGFGYEIPEEALSDPQFANMIKEAEKYLGYPYVWGGASPETSFDCSGFVCWVINHCGNGWNVGRTTAEGLRSYCSYVSPADARPGDLIFFEGTYETAGASHVGIYVGDNMMIHCGDPIQYTSIASPYWQQHFMAFGRIHS